MLYGYDTNWKSRSDDQMEIKQDYHILQYGLRQRNPPPPQPTLINNKTPELSIDRSLEEEYPCTINDKRWMRLISA